MTIPFQIYRSSPYCPLAFLSSPPPPKSITYRFSNALMEWFAAQPRVIIGRRPGRLASRRKVEHRGAEAGSRPILAAWPWTGTGGNEEEYTNIYFMVGERRETATYKADQVTDMELKGKSI